VLKRILMETESLTRNSNILIDKMADQGAAGRTQKEIVFRVNSRSKLESTLEIVHVQNYFAKFDPVFAQSR
jgi:hypothetical protein